jgi:hypothetical protein
VYKTIIKDAESLIQNSVKREIFLIGGVHEASRSGDGDDCGFTIRCCGISNHIPGRCQRRNDVDGRRVVHRHRQRFQPRDLHRASFRRADDTFSSYQALAILSPGGYELELSGSGYAITDNGTGGGMLVTTSTATGDTITGGGGFDNLILNGTGGIGGGYIEVDGNGNTVNTGTGPQAVNVYSNNDTVNVGSGNNTISIFDNNTTVSGGTGADTITATGNNEVIGAGTGPELINATGTSDEITGGSGNDTLNVFGTGDFVYGGSGADTIGLYGTNDVGVGGSGPDDVIVTGTGATFTSAGGTDTVGLYGSSETANISGNDTVNVGGNLDTVTAGAGAGVNNGLVNLNGATNFTFTDGPNTYNDTVVGFSQSAGDTIHLTGSDTTAYALANASSQNGGTLITLNDGSKIFLAGVGSVNPSFFS